MVKTQIGNKKIVKIPQISEEVIEESIVVAKNVLKDMIEFADKSIIKNNKEASKGDAMHNYTWELVAEKNEAVKRAYEFALRLLLDTPKNVSKEINRRNNDNKFMPRYDKSGNTIRE